MKPYIHLILALFVAILSSTAALQAQTVVLKADTVSIPCTNFDTFSVPIRVSNFTNMLGLSFTVRWNPAHLEFQAINMTGSQFAAAAPAVDTSNATTALGVTTFAWGQTIPTTVPNNSVVYRIIFKRLGGGSTPINFDGSQTQLLYINTALQELAPITGPGRVVVLDGTPPSLSCPMSVTLSGNGPTAVNGIAPTVSDNCGIDSLGWFATGATMTSALNSPNASGSLFNPGVTTVTYRAKDVGGNIVTCAFTINLINSGPQVLTVVASSASPNCGSSFFVDVSVQNFTNIGGLQFSVQWDKTLMQYTSVSNFNASINVQSTNFSELYTLSDGQLSFNWTSDNFTNGNTLNNGTVLFRINFTNLGNATATSTIGFGNLPTPPEAIAPNADPLPLTFLTGTIAVEDITPPSITCPASQSVAAGPSGTASITGLTATATDNCTTNLPITFVRSQPTGGTGTGVADGVFQAGTTTVTYSVTDQDNNTATCAFTVTVNATGLPGIKLDSVIHNCGQATVTIPVRVYNFDDLVGLNFQVKWDPAVLQYSSITNIFPGTGISVGSFPGINVLAPNGSLFFAETTSNPAGWPNIPNGGILFSIVFNVMNQNGTINITFDEPSDAINNVPEIIAANFINGQFTSSDQTPPTITCPNNIIVPAQANCQATVVIPSATATDACSGVSVINNNAPIGNLFPAGTTTVTFRAFDALANSSTCTMTVTVNANTGLTINCPQVPIVIPAAPNSCNGIVQYPNIVATNPCNPNANFTYNYSVPAGTSVGDMTVTLLATQIGGGGGIATCNININVVDQTPPTIVCPQNITISATGGECYALSPVVPFPTVTDNCSVGLSATTDQALLDTMPVGDNVLVFIATDEANNVAACSYQVSVNDGVAPELKCPDDITVPAGANSCSADVSWTAPIPTDNCTNANLIDLQASILPGSTFDVGTTIVEYAAYDNSNNSSTCSFVVLVSETTPPALTGCPDDILVILPLNDCDTMQTWTPPSFTDNCGLDTTIISHLPGTVFGSGTTPVTYTAIDNAGNSTVCTFNVIALDQVKPVFLTFPADVTVSNASACGAILNLAEPTVDDNCDPNPVVSYAGFLQDTFPVGVTRIEIKVQDASGNLTIDTLTITVLSTEIPSFTGIPSNITVSGCTGTATWTPPTPQGFCGQPVVTSSHVPGATFPAGVTTVTYTATDPAQSNFSVSVTFTVTVSENTPPAITCPPNLVLSAAGGIISGPASAVNSIMTDNCNGVLLNLTNANATDNCPTAPIVTQISGPSINNGNFPIGSHVLTFRANDVSNNSATCSTQIEVQAFEALQPNATPGVGCDGGTVLLEAVSVPGAVYSWSGPQGPINQQGSVHTITSFSAANAGQYIVSASLNGCDTGNDTVQAFLAIPPDAMDDLAFVVELNGALDSIDVLDNDVFAPAFDIRLTLDDVVPGLTLGSDNLLSFDAAGLSSSQVQFIYTICSEACPNLCDMATVTITIRDNECDFVPNIFTPNGDNANDWLEIPCLYSGLYPNNEIVIYNQWGDKVFEAKGYENDPLTAWQGTLNNEAGKDLPDGVYYYVFAPDANSPVIKGFVHIFR
jgi:gliding motility-associated-like protein